MTVNWARISAIYQEHVCIYRAKADSAHITIYLRFNYSQSCSRIEWNVHNIITSLWLIWRITTWTHENDWSTFDLNLFSISVQMVMYLKEYSTQKWAFSHILLSFPECIVFFCVTQKRSFERIYTQLHSSYWLYLTSPRNRKHHETSIKVIQVGQYKHCCM